MRIAVICVSLVIFAAFVVRSVRNPDSSNIRDDSAGQIMARMMEAYRLAQSYSDRGVIRITQSTMGQSIEESAPFAVRFERPGRLRLRAYQVLVASDSSRLRAKFVDREVPELARQVVDVAAPDEVDLAALKLDAFLWEHLEGGIGGLPVSLRLLLEENALADLFDSDVQLERLPSQAIGDQNYHVIQLRAGGMTATFWIDMKTYILRRFEYPSVDGLSLVADFQDARFDAPAAHDQFRVPTPDDARRVRYFVVPPQPLPTQLFGRVVGQFELSDSRAEQQMVSASDLIGPTKVLVWFNDHPSCRDALAHIQQVYESYRSNDQIRFYAVWAEGDSPDDSQLRTLLQRWEIDLPLARDLEAYGRDAFGIPVAPTLVVLDSQNRVQLFEVGVRADMEDFLPEVLGQLSAGTDVAAEVVRHHDQELRDFQRNLAAAGADAKEEVHELPQSAIQPPSAPTNFLLAERWRLTQLEAPGNVTVLDDGHSTSLAVNDGLRAVVELDMDGNIVARAALDLPPNGKVTYLHPAYDGMGNRYVVGGSSFAQQVFVFDDRWQTVMQYPATEQQHEGIQDARLFDLGGDGRLRLYLGFWGLVGIHAVEMRGNRLWSNRAAHSVLSLAATLPDTAGQRQLLVASAQGRLLPIGHDGQDSGAIEVASRAIYHLGTANSIDGKPVYCGLVFAGESHLALGIDEEFRETWSYSLPGGMQQTPVRPLATAPIFDGRTYWLFPGADGSIHIVSSDGAFQDAFHQGSAIRGLAAARSGEQSLLIVSTAEAVTAYEASKTRPAN